ncbi:hypothetical protein [Halalkalibacter krulwichiae]|uniref:Uncharacterized protein n=1 Tax=Halalkalibacter krulwichiae TaxID=199441 RepID=A0A1X9MEC7_9BACI|nr:hypothetical protein [Halalkalibacter krulwichiae]ARK28782.1 hypothetical protein BkAM31D_02350 [Halalkalibacter krulwichiae]
MRILLVMDSGKEYEIVDDNSSVEEFLSNLRTDLGVLKNGLLRYPTKRDVYFNPTHLSSIEVIED